MVIPNKLKHYGYHVVIAIDQLFNALTGAQQMKPSQAALIAVRY